MKRILKSSGVPPQLKQYIESIAPGSPSDSWDDFCDCSKSKREVQRKLYEDQRGLCAYCEIDIKPQIIRNEEGLKGKADFRVDHFHPKSDTATHAPSGCSWSLDWNNLLACCSGGDDSAVFDHQRCGGKTNQHCDAKKKDKMLDGVILNPLTDIPAFPPLFDERTHGVNADETILVANKDCCDKTTSDCYQKAIKTIECLNLNCKNLARSRHKTLRQIDKYIEELMKSGMPYEIALEAVMCKVFDDSSPTWPPFFTTIRAHYGIAAENRLREINYKG